MLVKIDALLPSLLPQPRLLRQAASDPFSHVGLPSRFHGVVQIKQMEMFPTPFAGFAMRRLEHMLLAYGHREGRSVRFLAAKTRVPPFKNRSFHT